ncbi:MAG: SpoIIE family protein phosphatase [Candidatus Rifleibacteriota bacterium]
MQNRFSFFRKLLIIFLFGFVPLLAVHFTLSSILEFNQQRQHEQYIEDLKNRLVKISQTTSADYFYFNFFTRLFRDLQQKPDKHKMIVEHHVQMLKELGTSVNFYVFNEKGNLEKELSEGSPNHFIIARTWDILAETPAYREGDEKKILKKIQLLLGGECSAGFLKVQEGQLISLRKKGKAGFLFWKRFSPDSRAGLLAYQLPTLQTIDILRFYRKQSRERIQIKFHPRFSRDNDDPATGMTRPMIVKKLLENQISRSCEFAGRYWAMARTSTGTFLASVDQPDFTELHNRRGNLNLLTLIVGLLLTIFMLRPELSLQNVFVSIRLKMAALVLIAIAIPLFGLLFTGTVSISDLEKIIVTRIENDQRQFLSAIEDDFSNEELNFSLLCENLHNLIKNGDSLEKIDRLADRMLEQNQAIRVEIRGLDGEIISLHSRRGYFEGLEKTHDAFSRYGIKRHLNSRLEQENVSLKKQPDKALIDIFESSDFGFSQILEAPGRAHYFKFGTNEMLWYWQLIDNPGHPAAQLTVFQSRNLSRENFLKSYLAKNPDSAKNLGLFNTSNRTWLKKPPTMVDTAEKLIEQAVVEGKSMQSIFRKGNKGFIAIALPGTLLAPFNIIHFTSDREISNNLNNLGTMLKLGIMLIVFITMLVAQMLSRTFILPIQEINRGLNAIQQRSENAKVSIDSHDEFGALAKAFNQMVDDLKEMQLARIVQESLFPVKGKKIPGYDLRLFNRPATDLGGDYCDFLEIDSENWLILIGDVSGHGASAALAMAMVKAAIFSARRDEISFEELPEQISELMITTLNKKKMMTMLFAQLNIKEHSISFLNAGHNWPLIIRKDGTLEEIKLSGLPMGIRRNRGERMRIDLKLDSKDMVFVYTDALIEGSSNTGEFFGHERLQDLLQNQSGKKPEELIDLVKNDWNNHLAGAKQEDDLTMLALQRLEVLEK